MFNSNKGTRDSSTALPTAAQLQASGGKRGMFSVLGPDVVVTGNIAASADLHIDGRVEGDVDCNSLVQGTDSRIVGSVKADTARLAGTIEGSVSVRQLTIERAARIIGDVEYETVAIENGASIDGRLKHVAADAGARVFDRTAPTVPTLVSAPDEDQRLFGSNDVAAA